MCARTRERFMHVSVCLECLLLNSFEKISLRHGFTCYIERKKERDRETERQRDREIER